MVGADRASVATGTGLRFRQVLDYFSRRTPSRFSAFRVTAWGGSMLATEPVTLVEGALCALMSLDPGPGLRFVQIGEYLIGSGIAMRADGHNVVVPDLRSVGNHQI